jgi:hypothetical protein
MNGNGEMYFTDLQVTAITKLAVSLNIFHAIGLCKILFFADSRQKECWESALHSIGLLRWVANKWFEMAEK